MQVGQLEDASHVRDSTGMRRIGADVVDQLLGDQQVAVPDRVEDLADGEGRRGVPANDAKALLQLLGDRVFEPKERILLDALSQPRCLDGRQPVMDIMKHVEVEAVLHAHGIEHLGDEAEIALTRPGRLCRSRTVGRLVEQLVAADAICAIDPGNTTLHSNRAVSGIEIPGDLLQQLGNRPAVGVPVDGDADSRAPSEQLVQRQTGNFGFDVPERDVDGTDRRHGHRAAPPVPTPVEVLPRVLDLICRTPDEQRAHVVAQIARDRQLAAVESRVTNAGDSILRCQLEGDEIPAGAGDDDLRIDNVHGFSLAASRRYDTSSSRQASATWLTTASSCAKSGAIMARFARVVESALPRAWAASCSALGSLTAPPAARTCAIHPPSARTAPWGGALPRCRASRSTGSTRTGSFCEPSAAIWAKRYPIRALENRSSSDCLYVASSSAGNGRKLSASSHHRSSHSRQAVSASASATPR